MHLSSNITSSLFFQGAILHELLVQQRNNKDLRSKSGFPGSSDGEESACNAGVLGLIPGLGISHGEGNGYPLQYSCLGKSMDRGGWWASVHESSKRTFFF